MPQSSVTAARKRRSLTSVSNESTSTSPARCGRSSPDVESKKSRTIRDGVTDSVEVTEKPDTSLERAEKSAQSRGDADSRVETRTAVMGNCKISN